jgi:hypothetical protein
MFLKNPFTLIDRDEMEATLVSDKELSLLIKKLISFHRKKCQRITCEHLLAFNGLIGLPHF